MIRAWIVVFLATHALADRWVVTSPQLVETLFELGHGEAIVGAVDGAHYPDAASDIPTVGALFWPSIERTVLLQPDWVVVDTHNVPDTFIHSLRATGLRSFVWDTHTVESFLDGARKFLALTNRTPPAWLDSVQACIASLATHPDSTAPRLLAFVWPDPPILFSSNSFLSQWTERLGYRPAVPATWKMPYQPVSLEWLIQSEPDVALFLDWGQALDFRRLGWRRAKFITLNHEKFSRVSFGVLRRLQESVGALNGGCHDLP